MVKPFEVVVCPVKHIEGTRFVWDSIHPVDIMELCLRNMKDRRNLSFQVKQGVNLDSTFRPPEMSPFINTEAEVNCRRIKGIDLSSEFEDVIQPHPLSDANRVISELFKDARISGVVCLGEVTAGNIPTQSEGVELLLHGRRSQDETSQRGLPGQLAKHQGEQLVPAGKVLDVLVAVILFHDAEEDKLIQEFDHLSENVRTCVHGGSISSAKLSSNRCALRNLATF